MNPADAERLRREILHDVGALLRDELAADEWGRVLVEVVRAPGGPPVVAGIDVEEIVGDESAVDAAFGGDSARALLPVLARATEALCGLADVDLELVRGGTFVRLAGEFAWLPGLVRAPSVALDRERDALIARLREKNDRLRASLAADHMELDAEASSIRWLSAGRQVGAAQATLIGTFAHGPRSWGWAWANPSATEATRRASAALTDALGQRDIWEISTPTFTTDEPTAWALAALLCDRYDAVGVQRLAREDGALFVLVRDLRAPASP